MPSNETQNIYSTPFSEGQGEPIPATRIGYDNTSSGLTADDVQDAIDEVAGAINDISATDVAYDNASSGITATSVQGAIDEVAGAIDDMSATNVAYDNTDSGLTATNVQGAVDEIAAQETKEKTPTFSINPTRYQCSKTSKLCMINAYWATPTTGDLTMTLPDDMKPDTSDYVEALAWDSTSSIIRCAISSAGVLTIPVDSSKNYSLIAIWDSI